MYVCILHANNVIKKSVPIVSLSLPVCRVLGLLTLKFDRATQHLLKIDRQH